MRQFWKNDKLLMILGNQLARKHLEIGWVRAFYNVNNFWMKIP